MISPAVVDASVGIKIRVNESFSARAAKIVQSASRGAVLLVPDLFFVECTNVLLKYIQRTGYPLATAQNDVAELRRLPLRAVPTAELVASALGLAAAHAMSAYDACYVALAIREGGTLVTGDEKLVNKLAGTAHPVRWIGSIPDQDIDS